MLPCLGSHLRCLKACSQSKLKEKKTNHTHRHINQSSNKMKLLTSLLCLNSTLAIKNYQCEHNQLPAVENGSWSCDKTGDNQRGETCIIKCDEGHYLPRPGPAKRARCKIDEQNAEQKSWSFPDSIPEGGFKCLGKTLVRVAIIVFEV